MKAKDVPQEDSVHYEGHQRACYAVDEHGRYTVVASTGWEIENTVNQLAVGDIRRAAEETRREVLAGRASPLAFHIARCQMTVPMLSAESGVWRWRVRRHLKPGAFARLKHALLARYAGALRMTVDELRRVPENPVA